MTSSLPTSPVHPMTKQLWPSALKAAAAASVPVEEDDAMAADRSVGRSCGVVWCGVCCVLCVERGGGSGGDVRRACVCDVGLDVDRSPEMDLASSKGFR